MSKNLTRAHARDVVKDLLRRKTEIQSLTRPQGEAILLWSGQGWVDEESYPFPTDEVIAVLAPALSQGRVEWEIVSRLIGISSLDEIRDIVSDWRMDNMLERYFELPTLQKGVWEFVERLIEKAELEVSRYNEAPVELLDRWLGISISGHPFPETLQAFYLLIEETKGLEKGERTRSLKGQFGRVRHWLDSDKLSFAEFTEIAYEVAVSDGFTMAFRFGIDLPSSSEIKERIKQIR
jgi:hypothetical protein